MARAFSNSEAKTLTNVHEKLYKELSAGMITQDGIRNGIANSVESMITKELLAILKGIPIEEINREKQGIKTKTLRTYGYETIADILNASVDNLEAINGISRVGGMLIRQEVDEIVEEAKKSARIRLNYDDQNEGAENLIKYLAIYRKSFPIFGTIRNLLTDYGDDVSKALSDLKPATSVFRWFFSSKQKKDSAEAAYEWLLGLTDSDYSSKGQEALSTIQEILKTSAETAWEDFRDNSISYYTLLEELHPGCVESDDDVYGLPEELAKDIQEQEVFSDGLLCTLRRYQEWGVKYILHQEKVLLGDEMGLGKTVQAIAAMVSLRESGGTHFLVICPASVLTNWCREITKHSKLSVTRIHGFGRMEAIRNWKEQGGVGVTTFETTAFFSMEEDFTYDMLIVDEAHYVKNPKAKRTINVKRISEHTEKVLFMTGTALENNVDEMLSLISILRPDIADDAEHIAFMSSASMFRDKIAPVYYRRKREDVLTELPEKIETKEWCTLSAEERKLYENAVITKRYGDVRRVSWNVPDVKNSSKANRLLELVEEAKSEDRKVIVFSFYLETIKKVTDLLWGRCMQPINGSVTPAKRQEILDAFEKAPAGTVLPAQIQAGGTGLNIQTASVVIFCEPQFKPSIENQAISRAYRMGQARTVLVYRLLCEDTVDERIMDILSEKQEIFDVFADQSAAATEYMELNDSTFGQIIEEEIEKIKNQKQE